MEALVVAWVPVRPLPRVAEEQRRVLLAFTVTALYAASNMAVAISCAGCAGLILLAAVGLALIAVF